MFEKNLRLVPLFDLYGELLSDAQRSMFDLYYNDDLSLSEIAENTGITRQGVRDSIKRAEEMLLAFEKKLGLSERLDRIERKTAEAETLLSDLRRAHPELGAPLDELAALVRSIL